MAQIIKENVGFSQISNVIADDTNLSLKAKGLYLYLFSKPVGWDFSHKRMKNQLKEGADAILSALRELEDAGYLVRKRLNTGKMQYLLGFSKAWLGKAPLGVTRAISNTELNNNTNMLEGSKDRLPTTNSTMPNFYDPDRFMDDGEPVIDHRTQKTSRLKSRASAKPVAATPKYSKELRDDADKLYAKYVELWGTHIRTEPGKNKPLPLSKPMIYRLACPALKSLGYGKMLRMLEIYITDFDNRYYRLSKWSFTCFIARSTLHNLHAEL